MHKLQSSLCFGICERAVRAFFSQPAFAPWDIALVDTFVGTAVVVVWTFPLEFSHPLYWDNSNLPAVHMLQTTL